MYRRFLPLSNAEHNIHQQLLVKTSKTGGEGEANRSDLADENMTDYID